MIGILAGTFAEADRWIRHTTNNPKFYVPICSIEDLLSRELDDVLVVGNFWDREDAAELFATAKSRIKERKA